MPGQEVIVRSHILIPLIALAVAAQSCCCCAVLGGPQPPYVIAPSDETAQQFKDRWDTIVKGSPDGTFTITVTEEEMTSLAAQMLAEQENAPPISDLQIHLRDGRIEVYATVSLGDSLPVPGMAAFSAAAIDGGISVALEEVSFGPLPIPDSALETATDLLNELIAESIQNEMERAVITDVQISAGEMTLTGTITPD
jgi:uncharacterized protein YpmS